MDDGIARAHRLARLHPEIVDDAIALVEEPDDRDAVLHRRQPRLVALEHLAGVRRLELLFVAALLLPARRQHECQRDCRAGFPDHSYSGVQGW